MIKIDTDRAIKLNRRYMQADRLGWRKHLPEIAELVGVVNQTPGEWMLAEEAARWQSSQKPELAVDGIIGPNTWRRMQHALGLTNGGGNKSNSIPPGPQTFAPGVPGGIPLDLKLVVRNKALEEGMLEAADKYYRNDDFRWFFTFAHGQITKQLNRNIARFQRPNALMRLNIHFAEEFLRALGGQLHDSWKEAFRKCKVLEKYSDETMWLWWEVEFCGAAMAKTHIEIDLSNALKEVGCIPRDDYGNMLILVERGSRAAVDRLRGELVGAAQAQLQKLVEPLVDMEVKQWRNAVFEAACNQGVPDPSPTFVAD